MCVMIDVLICLQPHRYKMKQFPSEKYILLTYKSHIEKRLPTTYYNSDSGWGCMLRVGQMALANYLNRFEHMPLRTILTLFWDNSDFPFSIQSLTEVSARLYPKKQNYEWYNPCEMGFIIKELMDQNLPHVATKIFLDNSMFLNEIPTDRPKLLLMVMIRIGLDEPEKIYLPVLEGLMRTKFFFCALGGTPKHAHLFLQVSQNKVGYLDPHKTTKAANSEEELLQREEEFLSQLSWIKMGKVDSSMALAFSLERQYINQFWCQLQALKEKHKQNFFLYIERERPQIEQGNLIEIMDD